MSYTIVLLQGTCEKQVTDMVQRFWNIIENISPDELGMICKVKHIFSFFDHDNLSQKHMSVRYNFLTSNEIFPQSMIENKSCRRIHEG